jgi:hypothetical protein
LLRALNIFYLLNACGLIEKVFFLLHVQQNILIKNIYLSKNGLIDIA